MTEPERARFVQRRRNELYEFAFYYLLFGPLLFAVPTLVLALLVCRKLHVVRYPAEVSDVDLGSQLKDHHL